MKGENKVENRGKKIAIANQKGGVGKSTTAVNLSTSLAMAGERILLIDIDPQGNSTSGVGIEKQKIEKCIYNVLMEDFSLDSVILPSGIKNLEVVPATLKLAGAEIELISSISRENRLEKSIRKLRSPYDYIIIDCPPSLGLLTINSLTAADSVLIPIQCEYYALEGLTQLLDVIHLVQKHLNPSLEIEGILLTMFDARVNLSSQVANEVRTYFGEKVYNTIIPRNVKLSEAPSFGKPVILYDRKSKGSEAYIHLAKEVTRRAKEGIGKGSGSPDTTKEGTVAKRIFRGDKEFSLSEHIG